MIEGGSRGGKRDWFLISEQPAPAPHLAHPERCAALRIFLVTVPRVSRSCEHFPGGFDLHLLRRRGKGGYLLGSADMARSDTACTGNDFKRFNIFPESQGQNLALTVFDIPHSLDNGWGWGLCIRGEGSPLIAQENDLSTLNQRVQPRAIWSHQCSETCLFQRRRICTTHTECQLDSSHSHQG